MRNFVISLSSATLRRAHISSEFAKEKVDFEFFDAITPETMAQACLLYTSDAADE